MSSLVEHFDLILAILVGLFAIIGFLIRLWMKNIEVGLTALHVEVTSSFERLDAKIIGIRNIVINLAQRVAHVEGRMGIDPDFRTSGTEPICDPEKEV